jgi:hypothetical protein
MILGKHAVAFGLATAVLACQTITEEMPQQTTSGPTGPTVPVVVVPIAIPTPVPAPVTTPAPEPNNPGTTPAPKPTAAPPSNGGGGGGGGGATGTVSVTAGVHSYLHNGQLVGHSSTTFNVGDVAYLNCTPRGEDRKPIDNHGPLQGWYVSGSAAHRVTDTDTFNPDLHTLGPGKVNIACKVDNITSPTTTLTIEP